MAALADDLQHARVRDADALRDGTKAHSFGVGLTYANAPSLVGLGRPRLLDLFCGAGGAAVGYHRAGFEVVGVDHVAQPRYPFEFVQADALNVLRHSSFGDWEDNFAAIHASPPCQRFSSLANINPPKDYPNLIAVTRALLVQTGLPFVIENVPGAPLLQPVTICGSGVGLNVRRHRCFETNWPLLVPPCAHGQFNGSFPVGLGSPSRTTAARSPVSYVYGSTRYAGDFADRKRAMDIDWMTNGELTQAIPPAYTELIGTQLREHLKASVAA